MLLKKQRICICIEQRKNKLFAYAADTNNNEFSIEVIDFLHLVDTCNQLITQSGIKNIYFILCPDGKYPDSLFNEIVENTNLLNGKTYIILMYKWLHSIISSNYIVLDKDSTVRNIQSASMYFSKNSYDVPIIDCADLKRLKTHTHNLADLIIKNSDKDKISKARVRLLNLKNSNIPTVYSDFALAYKIPVELIYGFYAEAVNVLFFNSGASIKKATNTNNYLKFYFDSIVNCIAQNKEIDTNDEIINKRHIQNTGRILHSVMLDAMPAAYILGKNLL